MKIRKLYPGSLKFRKDISEILLQGIYIDLEKQHQISTSKLEQSKQNTTKLDIHGNLSEVSFEISLHL